jgi:hypothetical protein
VNVASGGRADAVHGVRDREHVIREVPLKATLLPLGRPEVDHPRIHPVLVEAPDCRRAGGHVPDLGRQHHRWHQDHGRAIFRVLSREVAAEAVDRSLGHHLVRRCLLAGLEPAESRDFERVLRRLAYAGERVRDHAPTLAGM